MNIRVSKRIHGILDFLNDLAVANALLLLTAGTNSRAFYRTLPNDVASIHLCTPSQTQFSRAHFHTLSTNTHLFIYIKMLSFRSILLAAAALAIPTPETSSTGVTNVLGGLTSGEVVLIGSPLKRGQFSREFNFADNGLVGDLPAKVDVAVDSMSGKINNDVRDSRFCGDIIKQSMTILRLLLSKSVE
jgi:hypothetical protein